MLKHTQTILGTFNRHVNFLEAWTNSNHHHYLPNPCPNLNHRSKRSCFQLTGPKSEMCPRRWPMTHFTYTKTHVHSCFCAGMQAHAQANTEKDTHTYKVHTNTQTFFFLFEESLRLHNRSDCCRVYKRVQLWQHICRGVNLLTTKTHWVAVPFMWYRINIQYIISYHFTGIRCVYASFMSIKENILINSGRTRVCPGL